MTLQRATTNVKLADTMEEKFKLALRPELQPMVKWCMNWIRQERAERRKPNMEKLQCAWDQAQSQNPADELLNVPLDPKKWR